MNILQRFFSNSGAPFIILTLSLITWLICFPLFQDGMFIDGIQYAAIARNLARGVGSFWFPVLAQNSVAGLNTFHEHPPLVFYLQSLFFKVFGLQNIYPERIYGIAVFSVTALLMVQIWRKLFEQFPAIRSLSWFPVLLWILVPVVFWSYANNIQENTLTVFSTASVYFFLIAVLTGPVLKQPSFYAGCICIFLATLCKGIPGLFPVVFFAVYWVAYRKISLKSAIWYTVVTGIILAALTFILLQNNEARESLHIWFFDRMLKRIHDDPVVQNHFYILWGLLTEQLPAIILCGALFIILKKRTIEQKSYTRHFIFFLLLSLSGSLPLTLTLVQRNFYFTPVLPLFAIAWAIPVAEGLNERIVKFGSYRLWRSTAMVIFALVFVLGIATTVYKAGCPKRDKETLQDVRYLKKMIPENSFVSVTSDIMWTQWSFRCYMMRYNSISFSISDSCNYFIGFKPDEAPGGFSPVNSQLNVFSFVQQKTV